MKKRVLSILLTFVFALLFLVGCNNEQENLNNDEVAVVLLQSEGLLFEKNYYTTKSGTDITVNFKLKEGYEWEDCSYIGNYDVKSEGNNVSLTLKKVKYDCRISFNTIAFSEKYATITLTDVEGLTFDDTVITVEKGQDVSVGVIVEQGYILNGCTYNGDFETREEDNKFILTFLNVQTSQTVAVNANCLLSENVNVNILKCEGVKVNNYSYVIKRGENLVLSLQIEEGYEWENCSYNGEYQTAIEGNNVSLVLKDINQDINLGINVNRLTDNYAFISLVNNQGVSSQKDIYAIRKGNNTTINLQVKEGFIWQGCSYDGEYQVIVDGENISISLSNVQQNKNLTIRTNRISGKIFYYLNGGTFIDKNTVGDYYIENGIGVNRVRVNTSIGSKTIKRDGYTLIEWNTKADGTGDHVGLGSRITVSEGQSAVLYAQWAKWSPASWFTYSTNHQTIETGDIKLDTYVGETELDNLVIPAEINGKKVSYIEAGFSDGLKIDTLILPNTMHTIKIGCFKNSVINNIVFYDNIQFINDGCFEGTISTVYINAYTPPRYVSNSNKAVYAEVMDRMILNADKKKMIFFAGCSMNYGLNSKTVDDAFNNEYVVCDLGVIGSINATFMLENILRYTGEGDVFIHAPEQMSPYQLLHKLRGEQRMFICVEGNYDLLSLVDATKIPAIFESFTIYNSTRWALPVCSYEEYYERYNEYGDDIFERPNSEENTSFGLETLFENKYLSETAFTNLNDYYGQFIGKGVSVYFSFAPINIDALSEEERESQSWVTFENTIRTQLDSRVKVISTATDYMMEGKYFFDTDYHLTTEGAQIRTATLVRDLKQAMALN